MTRTLAIVIAVALGPLGWSTTGAAAPADPPSADTLPKAARAAMNKTYPGWQVAPVTAVPVSSCAVASAAATGNPVLVESDLDGDLQEDLAFYVEVAGAIKLVAVLDRLPDYQVFELELPSDTPLPLTIAKQGGRYVTAYPGVDDFLSANTIALDRCGAGRSLFLWRGQSFERVDSPTPAATTKP